jgi:isobutyryl-CoA dehydrogenase
MSTLLVNSEQIEFQNIAKQFAEKELYPNASKWDSEKIFPIETFKKAAELGFGSIYVNSQYGGTGLGRLEASLKFEQLSMGCVSTAAYLSIHNMCCWMIGILFIKYKIILEMKIKKKNIYQIYVKWMYF